MISELRTTIFLLALIATKNPVNIESYWKLPLPTKSFLDIPGMVLRTWYCFTPGTVFRSLVYLYLGPKRATTAVSTPI